MKHMSELKTSFSEFEAVGILKDDFKLIEETQTNKTYVSFIEINRLSGVVDSLPIHIPDSLLSKDFVAGQTIKILGEIENHITYDSDNKKHFQLFIFVKNIEIVNDETSHMNNCHIQGFICKKSECRSTPKGRVIADLVIAVNHNKAHSSYLPVVVWNRAAYSIFNNSKIGDHINLNGRFQSRDYKKDDKNYTTYEISTSMIGIIDNNDEKFITN